MEFEIIASNLCKATTETEREKVKEELKALFTANKDNVSELLAQGAHIFNLTKAYNEENERIANILSTLGN